MGDIEFMRGHAVRVGRLEAVALLVPAPVDGPGPKTLDVRDILPDVWQVEPRVQVLLHDLRNIFPLEGQRQAGEGQVRGDVVVGVVLLRAGGLSVLPPLVELRAVEGLGVVDERRSLRRAGVAAHGEGPAVRAVLDPLCFAGLPRDHRYGVRGGWRVLGREDVVEYRKAAGPLPEERDGVAVDVGHHQPCELRSLGNRWLRRP